MFMTEPVEFRVCGELTPEERAVMALKGSLGTAEENHVMATELVWTNGQNAPYLTREIAECCAFPMKEEGDINHSLVTLLETTSRWVRRFSAWAWVHEGDPEKGLFKRGVIIYRDKDGKRLPY